MPIHSPTAFSGREAYSVMMRKLIGHVRLAGGISLQLQFQKGVSREDETEMVVPAGPGPSLEMIEAERAFQPLEALAGGL